jgi:hypothetical protein
LIADANLWSQGIAGTDDQNDANAAYIAAMSPDVTLTLVAELRTLRAALGDAEIWFQAEADHPRPDPRPAMAAQAVIIRDLLAALDATREETT